MSRYVWTQNMHKYDFNALLSDLGTEFWVDHGARAGHQGHQHSHCQHQRNHLFHPCYNNSVR